MKNQRFVMILLFACCGIPVSSAADAPKPAKPPAQEGAEPAKPTAHTERKLEGWTVRVDDRLLKGPEEALGTKALRFLEGKLSDITVVLPEDKLKKLQAVVI